MERVTYILGAGFSAPMGLPVMSNFLAKAKELYFADEKRYAHFNAVFQRISKLSVAKNYFHADLWNIEEILSILEMDEQLGSDKRSKSRFVKVLADTVLGYTPPLKPSSRSHSNWSNAAFGEGEHVQGYGAFVCELLGVTLSRESDAFVARKVPRPKTTYSVITLNYDMLLENVGDFIATQYQRFGDFGFHDGEGKGSCPLYKLHGSVSDESIIPPTWNKSLRPGIRKAWKGAYEALRTANHIRILGYSLPVSDAYVRYLLKASVTQAPHLKSIHVLTADPTGATKRAYDELIEFNYYEFNNGRIEQYLDRVARESYLASGGDHRPGQLEAVHSTQFG